MHMAVYLSVPYLCTYTTIGVAGRGILQPEIWCCVLSLMTHLPCHCESNMRFKARVQRRRTCACPCSRPYESIILGCHALLNGVVNFG